MEVLLLLGYMYLGGKANSFIKYHALHVRAVYVFNWVNFIVEKVALALFLGWLTIPAACLLWILGVGRR